MRHIVCVTTSRADYGLYRSTLRSLEDANDVKLSLVVGGAHLRDDHGLSIVEVESDGHEIVARVDMLGRADDPLSIATAMGLATTSFAVAVADAKADLLVVLGDRFEMHAAAVAAVPFLIPVAHVHGGEVTEGAFDDSLRHSITKLSHLHFVTHEDHGRRIRQLGEEPWRITVVGAPGLDNVLNAPQLSPEALEALIGIPFDPPPLLVTMHPVTLEPRELEGQLDALLSALATVDLPVVFTAPNADPGGRAIRSRIDGYLRSHRGVLISNLGTAAYASLLRRAAAMVGNSSSGIIEAPSFGLPVVNIGSRQQGRIRAMNVIDVPPDRDAIVAGIRHATDPSFRASIEGAPNPYGDGSAGERIAGRLRSIDLGPRLLRKAFMDWTEAPDRSGG